MIVFDMVVTIQCPAHDELIRLNHDKLSNERSEVIFDHIEQCESCAEFFGKLDDLEDGLDERLAQIKTEDLDKARQAMQEDTYKEMATLIRGKL